MRAIEPVAGDAGVVHEELDRPERVLDLVEGGVDRVGVVDGGPHGERRRRRPASTARLRLLRAVVVGE